MQTHISSVILIPVITKSVAVGFSTVPFVGIFPMCKNKQSVGQLKENYVSTKHGLHTGINTLRSLIIIIFVFQILGCQTAP